VLWAIAKPNGIEEAIILRVKRTSMKEYKKILIFSLENMKARKDVEVLNPKL